VSGGHAHSLRELAQQLRDGRRAFLVREVAEAGQLDELGARRA